MRWQAARVNGDFEKRVWVSHLPAGEATKDALARLVDRDHDEAETEYYEAASDPEYEAIERAQRRYRGMFRRRLRHRVPKHG